MKTPLFLPALALLAAFTFSARALVVPVAEDTSSTGTGLLTPGNGKAPTLTVSAKQTALIRFNLTDLNVVPSGLAGARLRSAVLQLYVTSVKTPGELTVSEVTTDWHETFSGKTAPLPTIDTADAGVPIPAAEIGAKRFVSVDLTAAVGNALQNSLTFGFAIRATDATKVTLASKEGAATGCSAVLILDLDFSTDESTAHSETISTLTLSDAKILLGVNAPLLHTTGVGNFFAGALAGNFTLTGAGNSGVGANALVSDTTGASNAAFGKDALSSNTTGSFNIAVGTSALAAITSGDNNVAAGFEAGNALATGSGNILLGYQAGFSIHTGSNNIDIGAQGVGDESNIIRIGSGNVHTATYLAGVINGNGSGLTGITNLNLPATDANGNGVIWQAGMPLVHTFGPGDGQNFFAGQNTGNFTLTSDATYNTGIGTAAMESLSSGRFNTAVGHQTLFSNTTGIANTAVGLNALVMNSDGSESAAFGFDALLANNAGHCAAFGASALTGSTGIGNIGLGYQAGVNLTTGDYNIDIGNSGVAGEGATIRIGDANRQSATFLAGIRGVTTGANDAVPVMIDSNGQLGTISSSRRYKEDIADMGDASARLDGLRPVTFRYKQPYADGEKPVQFGLIAEEVAKVFPELCVRNAEGQPETVKYQDLAPLLLNEFLKERRHAKEVEKTLREENAELKARLERLERVVGE